MKRKLGCGMRWRIKKRGEICLSRSSRRNDFKRTIREKERKRQETFHNTHSIDKRPRTHRYDVTNRNVTSGKTPMKKGEQIDSKTMTLKTQTMKKMRTRNMENMREENRRNDNRQAEGTRERWGEEEKIELAIIIILVAILYFLARQFLRNPEISTNFHLRLFKSVYSPL